MSLSTTQIEALQEPLSRTAVKQRKQGNFSLSYIEGHHAIREANRIFGFDGWERRTKETQLVQTEQKENDYKKMLWYVGYIAKCEVVIAGVTRDGTGFGQGIDADLGRAHESAIKEAETDAMKRALMTFGDQFGLALYDKDQANVSDNAAPVPAKERKGKPDPTAPFGWLMTALDPGDWQIKTVSDKQAKFFWEQCAQHGLSTPDETAAFRSYVCRAYGLPAEIINKAGGYSFGIEFLKDAHDDCILKAMEETQKALASKKASKEAA